jgi:hypothetical protein
MEVTFSYGEIVELVVILLDELTVKECDRGHASSFFSRIF